MDQLTESRDHLNITLNSIQDAVVVVDNRARILRMNPAAESMTGWTLLETEGRSLDEVVLLRSVESGEPAINPLIATLKDKRICYVTEVMNLEERSGRFLEISLTSAPLVSRGGDLKGAVLVMRDVTDMMHLQEQRNREKQQFQDIVEQTIVPMMVFNSQSIEFSNQATADILGARVLEELLGLSPEKIIHPDHLASVQDRIRRVMAGARVETMIDRWLTLDGKEVDVESTGCCVDSADGVRGQVIFQDVTRNRKKTVG